MLPNPLPDPLQPPPAFTDRARDMGLEFEPGDLHALGLYLALLLEVNKAHNLTAVTDPSEVWTRHVLDALTLLPLMADLPDNAAVIDVGSGGGIPGIPLAICLPHLRFTLLEATGKKAEFLRQTIAALGLRQARVLQERAERAGQDHRAHRERYDAVIARAVGPLPTLAELTVPLAKPPQPGTPGGLILLIKGARADQEVLDAKQALYLLHAAHVQTIDTPTGRIVVLDKLRKTPRDYPRADGEPKRSPLGQPATRTRTRRPDAQAQDHAGP